MSKIYEGKLLGEGLKIGIVVSRFNEFITTKLLEGAKDALLRHGVKETSIDIAKTPGAFEIPVIAKKMVQTNKYNAVICLGAVIRGGTPHFDYIAAEVSKGIAQVALDAGIPVVFGIITADTLEQAIERAGTKMGNAGYNAGMTAVESANLLKEFENI